MRRILSSVLSLFVVFTMLLPVGSYGQRTRTLKDIENHWAKNEIRQLVSKGVIKGYPNGNFGPEDNITREQLAVILNRALNLNKDNRATVEVKFADVDPSYWAYDYIKKVYLDMGYAEIEGKNYFLPEQDATREEIVGAIIRASGLENSGNENLDSFKDKGSIPEYAKDEFAIAVNNKIINGKIDNGVLKLDPNGFVTRAEVAKIIMNLEKNTDIKVGKNNGRENNNANFTVMERHSNNKIHLSWNNVPKKWGKPGGEQFEFLYYKVVASINNSNPRYPKDGYAAYYKDINHLVHTISAGDSYTKRENADIDKFFANQKYYIRITAVYADHHYIDSNVIYTTL